MIPVTSPWFCNFLILERFISSISYPSFKLYRYHGSLRPKLSLVKHGEFKTSEFEPLVDGALSGKRDIHLQERILGWYKIRINCTKFTTSENLNFTLPRRNPNNDVKWTTEGNIGNIWRVSNIRWNVLGLRKIKRHKGKCETFGTWHEATSTVNVTIFR